MVMTKLTGETKGREKKKHHGAIWTKKKKKHRNDSHLIIPCSKSEEVSEVSEQANE